MKGDKTEEQDLRRRDRTTMGSEPDCRQDFYLLLFVTIVCHTTVQVYVQIVHHTPSLDVRHSGPESVVTRQSSHREFSD